MAVREILLLGNPLLHQACEAVSPEELSRMREVMCDLEDTLFAFRAQHGVGRAIAAPQIGVMKRAVYLNVGEPVALLNPKWLSLSEESFEIWDDCMSFSHLLVRVKRHVRGTLQFQDLHWESHQWQIEGNLAELLQHELDHLDGVMAVARAIDGHSFAFRSQTHLLQGRLIEQPVEMQSEAESSWNTAM